MHLSLTLKTMIYLLRALRSGETAKNPGVSGNRKSAWCLLAVIGSWSLGFANETWIELGPDPFG